MTQKGKGSRMEKWTLPTLFPNASFKSDSLLNATALELDIFFDISS